MQETFLSAYESVAADLRSAQRNPDGSLQFTIPRNHIDLWLSAMNQARLALAEINQFTNDDLSRPRPPPTIRGVCPHANGHLQQPLRMACFYS